MKPPCDVPHSLSLRFQMANTATQNHLDQERLSSVVEEKNFETLAEWLSKESTGFGQPSEGKKKCVDSQLVQMLQPLFQNLEFVRNVRFAKFGLVQANIRVVSST